MLTSKVTQEELDKMEPIVLQRMENVSAPVLPKKVIYYTPLKKELQFVGKNMITAAEALSIASDEIDSKLPYIIKEIEVKISAAAKQGITSVKVERLDDWPRFGVTSNKSLFTKKLEAFFKVAGFSAELKKREKEEGEGGSYLYIDWCK